MSTLTHAPAKAHDARTVLETPQTRTPPRQMRLLCDTDTWTRPVFAGCRLIQQGLALNTPAVRLTVSSTRRPTFCRASTLERFKRMKTEANTQSPFTSDSTTSSAIDADRLAVAVSDMASLVEETSLRIQAIARTGCLSLETEGGSGDTETLAQLLGVIESLATNLNDGVLSITEQVGVAAHSDRLDARQQARLAQWAKEHGGKSNV